MRYKLAAAIAAWWLAFPASPAIAQGAAPAGPTPESMCGLLTKAQVEKEIGRKLYSGPEGMRIGGGVVCDFDGGEAQVMLFTGTNSEANWEGMLKRFGHEKAKRTPVPGLGAPAYVIYPPPKNQYQETVAMLVVTIGQGTLIVSSSVNKGEPAEKALAPTIALTRLVLPKLK
ncbi:MAG TPA: hypothetical protein VJ817_08080 [Gemmatimonadales bacterium]|nr:hypothetical protein [Gemmatimonadales bacterium]